MRIRIVGGLAAAALALTFAMPAAAATPEHFAYTDTTTIPHECGIVEHLHADVRGTAYFAGDGTWLRDIVQFQFDSVFESAQSGRTMTSTSRQVAEYTPDGATLTGQGFFLRGKGGVIVLDVGRLVATWADGTTFTSAHSIPIEPGPGSEALEAALCDALS
jgi:hypothetical protein